MANWYVVKNNRHRINIDGNNKVKIEFCFRKLNFHSIEMDCYAGLQRRCGYNWVKFYGKTWLLTLEKLAEIEHPNAKDMHRYISDNSQKFKLEFIKAYNGKCAYCGASIDLIKRLNLK